MTMKFTTMRNNLMKHFENMTADADFLFEVELDKDALWNTYLSNFPEGTDPIYRTRSVHDCSCCRHFVKSIGNIVTIKDGKLTTLWDFDAESNEYQPSIDALAAFVKAHAVTNIFLGYFKTYGTFQNYEQLEDGSIKEWTHFFLTLPSKFMVRGSQTLESIQATHRTEKELFQNALETITEDALLSVLDLIASDCLYKGDEWKRQVEQTLRYKRIYNTLSSETEKNLCIWEWSVKLDAAITRIKNTAVGTLLLDISEGMNVDAAVRKYEQIVAPSNYKRSKPIFTQKMLEDAQNKIKELGYMESLGRRYAKLDDITINNILFANRDSVKRISGTLDLFDSMKAAISNVKKFSKIIEMPVDNFIKDVLPTAQELEVFLENKHQSNMVSLIAPTNKDSKTMFKWNNNFSWAYAGNVTDSMKERVKAAGGRVDGDLRFSIQWNEDGKDNSDLDAHCIEPTGNEIFFGNCRKPNYSHLGGQLDVDIISPGGHVAVENITWADRNRMMPGVYKFFVHQYSGSIRRFKAEIEFDGQLYEFDYDLPVRSGEKVQVAEITLHPNGTFTLKEIIKSSVASREIWNLTTNQFVPVSVVMHSPNYWDEQSGIGHKHLFFMLKNCINDESPNGFYNEFLNNELNEHRRVMEAIGGRLRVEDCEDQLSGVGFSMSKRDAVIVKVKGATEKTIKVLF